MRSFFKRQVPVAGILAALTLAAVPVFGASPACATNSQSRAVPQKAGSASAINAIRSRETLCKRRTRGNPDALQDCHLRATKAANALLPRSTANARLDSLFAEMFDPIMLVRTEGYDALADRVTISDLYTEFSLTRVAIREPTGVRRPWQAGRCVSTLAGFPKGPMPQHSSGTGVLFAMRTVQLIPSRIAAHGWIARSAR